MGKAKKKGLSEMAQRKRNENVKRTLNPFEVHVNKDKLKVIGRKSKTDKGLPGISRAKAINKRKGTLLQEYKLKNKDNIFLDKRIGEKNTGMTQEDKAIARFAAERIRAHKKQNIYSLNDEEILTHRGQTLEEIEKFDDPKSDDEFSDGDDQTGKLGKAFVRDAHFGGGTLSKSESSMSRKDLIEQLIAESKKRKAEKQKLREETIDLTERLDSEWKDLLPVMSASKQSATDDDVQTLKADDYDIEVRKLKFEARGTPSEKLKSEDEIIREEKEELEALEADRLARMKGFIDNVHGEIKHKSADDLDDCFAHEKIDDEPLITKQDGLVQTDQQLESENSNDEENNEPSIDDDEQDHESNKDSVSNDQINRPVSEDDNVNAVDEIKNNMNYNSDTENSSDNLSDLKNFDSSSDDESEFCDKATELEPIVEENKFVESHKPIDKQRQHEIRADLLKRKEIMEKARKELPYTYNVPNSFEDLEKLLSFQHAEYQAVIIERIMKCNHWSLNKENKEKLLHLFEYLLQYLDNCALKAGVESVVKYFQVFDRLCPYLYDLAHIDPQTTKNCIQGIIRKKHEEFEKNKKKYPDLNTLILFKLVSLLFPTSDYRHPIVTPCLVFMSQILLRCRVKDGKDVSKGLFICTLILEYTVLSKRFAPSAINYLRGIIYISTPKHLVQGSRIIPPFKTIGESSRLLVLDTDHSQLDMESTYTLMKAYQLVCDDVNEEFKIKCLLTATNLVYEFKEQLKELEAAYLIFEPLIKILKLNTYDKYPLKVKQRILEIYEQLNRLQNTKLEYLTVAKKKPKPLRLYEPRVETIYDGKMHKRTSKEMAEKEKLLHKYKREMKGAVREIRKDQAFLAKVQIKEQVRNDAERKRKVKEIFGDAAVQQSELNKMKRKK